jgi:pyruvate,orthophosphate dikinase
MEFTFEGDAREDLYILQSRDMAIRERKKFMTFDHSDLGDRQPIGHGIGVSGGAMSGRLVFTLDEIDYWRKLEPQTALVLARSDTVPDDIREIHASDGLLTSRGGLTSHAAVVAHRLGRTGVVGCGNLICDEKKKLCRINDIVLSSGDYISINGQEGSVYQGLIKVQEV